MLLLANSGRTSYAWTDADMRRSAVPLEDAMFNTVADEIDGFDLGTNAGRASERPRGGPATSSQLFGSRPRARAGCAPRLESGPMIAGCVSL
jgi:hypothetical protein